MNASGPRGARNTLSFAAAAGVAALFALSAASCGSTVSFACPDGYAQCGDVCAALDSDPDHCGACDFPCPDGIGCQAGVCTSVDPPTCPPGLVDCGGACVDLGNDPQHCGGCGVACPPGAPICGGGSCQGGCPPGTLDCGGFCADIVSDPQNCGGCGVVCPAGAACLGGVCDAGCPPGFADCGGFCVHVLTDPQNCGGCGIVCPPSATCTDGLCTTVPCPPGLTSCGGACVDLLTDPSHCGGCFDPCGPGTACQGGVCGCPGGACGACDVVDLGSTVPQVVTGSILGAPDTLEPSCAPAGSGEDVYSFTAPLTGQYVLDTGGSSYDTVLYLYDGNCIELACNDDFTSVASHLELFLDANQTVLVVVDGYGGSAGTYALSIDAGGPVTCPDGALGAMVPQTISGSTAGMGNDVSPVCGPVDGEDMAFSFTAPFADTFTFDTFGSTFDTVLHVRNGCGGASLACNDDTMGLQSQLSLPLAAGQTVIVVVDGFGGFQSGPFVLHVSN